LLGLEPNEASRPLSGSLSSNRNKVPLQSPLVEQEVSEAIRGSSNTSKLEEMKIKLDNWEKIALAMVKDIRELKATLENL